MTIQKYVVTLKYQFEKIKFEEEHATVWVDLHISTILARSFIVLIGLGWTAKYFESCGKDKSTSTRASEWTQWKRAAIWA